LKCSFLPTLKVRFEAEAERQANFGNTLTRLAKNQSSLSQCTPKEMYLYPTNGAKAKEETLQEFTDKWLCLADR